MPHRERTLAWLGAWLWGGVLLTCALGLAALLRDGLPADTRLTAMLPEDRQSPLIERADMQLGQSFEDRFVLLFSSPTLSADTRALVQALTTANDNADQPWLARLDWRDTDLADQDPRDDLGKYRYRLLAPSLRQAIIDDGGQALVDSALRDLFAPTGQPQPVVDPFGLLDRWLGQLDKSPIQPSNGLLTLTNDNRTHALLVGQLARSPYDLEAQQALTDAIASFEHRHPDVSLLRSGLVFHAAAGAHQARQEITTIGLGALTGLVAILWFVFRSVRVLAYMLLPLAGGVLFALPLTLLVFGQLHLLTLAFGASLIGIAIDYALHVQSHRTIQSVHFRLRPLLPGLTLGLVSSLLAYLAQALTPLPGLRQMAMFAAMGLLGAWLTVVLWLPRLTTPVHPFTGRLAQRLWQLTMPRRRLAPALAISLALALTGIVGWQLKADDSLRLLNPSPAWLLEQERHVQRLMGSNTGDRYFLVTAPSEAEVLVRLAELGDNLEQWKEDDISLRYTNLADSVPPPDVQQANLAQVRQLYGGPLSTLFERAGLSAHLAEKARQQLQNVPILDVATWLATSAGQGQARLWLGSVSDTPVRFAAMLPLADVEANVVPRLERLAQTHEGISYVDRVERLSGLLGELRTHIAWWVIAAVAGLSLLLAWRYRRRTWRVLTPPLGAILGVLAAYALAGIPLNVFSQLGLLLVLGIGLDAGIFSVEHAHRAETWLAISLSTLTSLLAFGLLAFSATPALHYLGLSCLVGLALVWLLVPWVRPCHSSFDSHLERQDEI
ncbi:MMPL family transporter [Modicisalibacter luteus]|uniref:MMPL family transporter n=1 Tax=Modicisalibacter luteus TaxID=453962 RepID=A0ABV7LZY1_9GAMM|nr:hypothetical protein [Halomonas lutea]GHA96746.1 membrane protein [Halomonas lutea]